jgi:hypothetical protein
MTMHRQSQLLSILFALGLAVLPNAGRAHFNFIAHGHPSPETTQPEDYDVYSLYPGAFCDAQRYRGYTQGGVFNSHSYNGRTLFCPATNNRPFENHIGGFVDVIDRSASHDFSCTLKHQISEGGATIVSGGVRRSYGTSDHIQRLNFLPISEDRLFGYHTDPNHSRHDRTSYYYQCVTPPVYDGTITVWDADGLRYQTGRFISEIRQYFVGEWRNGRQE